MTYIEEANKLPPVRDWKCYACYENDCDLMVLLEIDKTILYPFCKKCYKNYKNAKKLKYLNIREIKY